MEYKQLEQVNKAINYTDIKGKQYAEVNQRILGFRTLYPNGAIETEIISDENGKVIVKAIVKDEAGNILATGHSYEKENSSYINKTSYIENCETSAVGRALGILGIGIKDAIASASELAQAKAVQSKNTSIRNELVKLCKMEELDLKAISKKFNLTNESPDEDFEAALNYAIEQTKAFD